jgi:hypothetical protein
MAITSGTILPGMCNITQGSTVSQRIGDTVFWKNAYINYTVDAINADVFSTFRIIIFQWHPNSSLIMPVVTDILQTASMYSMYDWQYSNQYTILYDKVHCLTGIVGAPCDAGNQAFFGEINLKKAVKRADFASGTPLGSEEFYIMIITDSVLAPGPNFNAVTRVVYSEDAN